MKESFGVEDVHTKDGEHIGYVVWERRGHTIHLYGVYPKEMVDR